LDGRGVQVPDFPEGNFIGPTVISNVQTYMECYQKEIMGPVLVCLQVDNLDEAIEILNENRCERFHPRPSSRESTDKCAQDGNGCSIFTTNSGKAMTFQKRVNIGRIGINVPLLGA
jgi:malonate-semialdehyde dehydrogenase (acetylating)/methylmalonate-semialdehyde dehydrogenase